MAVLAHSHVAEVSDFALVEGTSLDLLSTSEERECDRNTTSASKTDDGHTEERIEGGDRSKVDAGQSHLNGGVEVKGVQWHLEPLGHFAPDGVSGNTAISREAGCQYAAPIMETRLTPKHIWMQLESKQDHKKGQ